MPPNRLIAEPSPYLRQHGENPVDWYPWGEEALARARSENKPILLSVGYSACHWCHVMAHESFEDPETAGVMNAHFVNVKVDREERPDLDQIYQGVVQLTGRGGGWPLTVFLTPDLRPFYGGTYFPPSDRYGMPSFKKLLHTLAEAWRSRAEEVAEQAAQFEAGLVHLAAHGLGGEAGEITGGDVREAALALATELDPEAGGFGNAPKFPNPMAVALLLRGWRRGAGDATREGAFHALEAMALGGVYDQVGGGFHRYSVDRAWRVPHFEKMLYDNAQLLHLYAEAQQVSPRPLWRKIAEETVEWLDREMTALSGAFYATQDADSEGEEGKFFVWTLKELEEVLGPERGTVAALHFGVGEPGNFEHGRSVLEVRLTAPELSERLKRPAKDLEGELAEIRRALFAARRRRVAPARDDKVLAGWNGLMIRGLALAARVFERPDWAARAERAADAILGALFDGRRLARVQHEGAARFEGMLEDYGDLAAGLTALYQATFEVRWLEQAAALADAAVERFWDESRKAYFTAPRGQRDLVVAPYALHDNAVPSGASTLSEAQVALAALTGRGAYLDQARAYVQALRSPMRENPFGYGHLWLAADALADGAAEVSLVGGRTDVAPFISALSAAYAPTVAVAHIDPDLALPAVLAEAAAGRTRVEGKAAAYLCRNFACQAPVTSPPALRAALLADSPPQSSVSGRPRP